MDEEFEQALLRAAEHAMCVVYFHEGGEQCHTGRRHPECMVEAILPVIEHYTVPRRRIRRTAKILVGYVRSVVRPT